MAQLAGMTLRGRWGGWKGEPFTSDSRKHVSVWERPAAWFASSEGLAPARADADPLSSCL